MAPGRDVALLGLGTLGATSCRPGARVSPLSASVAPRLDRRPLRDTPGRTPAFAMAPGRDAALLGLVTPGQTSRRRRLGHVRSRKAGGRDRRRRSAGRIPVQRMELTRVQTNVCAAVEDERRDHPGRGLRSRSFVRARRRAKGGMQMGRSVSLGLALRYGTGYIGIAMVTQTMLLWLAYFYAPPPESGLPTLLPVAWVGWAILLGRIV